GGGGGGGGACGGGGGRGGRSGRRARGARPRGTHHRGVSRRNGDPVGAGDPRRAGSRHDRGRAALFTPQRAGFRRGARGRRSAGRIARGATLLFVRPNGRTPAWRRDRGGARGGAAGRSGVVRVGGVGRSRRRRFLPLPTKPGFARVSHQ